MMKFPRHCWRIDQYETREGLPRVLISLKTKKGNSSFNTITTEYFTLVFKGYQIVYNVNTPDISTAWALN